MFLPYGPVISSFEFFQPLQQSEWFGNARGYNISFKEVDTISNTTKYDAKSRVVTIEDTTSNSYILDNLEEFTQYEVVMIAFNDVGFSAPSPTAIERTRESGNYLFFLVVNVR